jgi:hypothetical protein
MFISDVTWLRQFLAQDRLLSHMAFKQRRRTSGLIGVPAVMRVHRACEDKVHI